MKFFNARRTSYHTNPRIIDDVIYTPYVYDPPTSQQRQVHFQSDLHNEAGAVSETGDLLGVPELIPGGPDANGPGKSRRRSKFEEKPTEAEIFLFEYGTVVIWGMTEAQEKRFLSSMWVILLIFTHAKPLILLLKQAL